MFNFKNRFQYFPAPLGGGDEEVNDGSGGGGIGGGGVVSIGSTYTPTTYNNLYFDFVSAESYTDYVLYPDADFYGIKYYKIKKNNTLLDPILKISQTDTILTSPTAYTWTRGVSNTCTVRRYWGIGKQEDSIDWFITSNSSQLYFNSNPISYLILQRAVPVTQYVTLDILNGELATTILGSNSSTNIVVGVNFKLKKTLSRGKELGSSWSFLKSDPNGTFVNQPAILNVDYQLVTGSNTSDEIIIKFLTSLNFTVKQTVSGYTFNGNPYEIFSTQTEPNTTITSYSFNTTAFTFDTELKFPKVEVELSVPTEVLLGTTPFETYQGQDILITPTLNLINSYWKQYLLSNPASFNLLPKTKEEWKIEMDLRCNTILEVRDKETNALILTKQGLEPYTIILQDIKSFNLQIKTILR